MEQDKFPRRNTSGAADRTRNAGLIGLLGIIAEAAVTAATVPDILRVAVKEICRFLNWPVGHALVPSAPSAKKLVSAGIWHLDEPKRFAPFRRISSSYSDYGRGLIGHALAGKEAIWAADITAKNSKFLRREAARAAGLTTGLLIPAMTDGRIAAVLEFYTTARAKPDAALLSALNQIAHHVGQVAGRIHAREELHWSENLFKAVFENAVDAFIIIDERGIMQSVNRATERIFGFVPAEIVGWNVKLLMPEDTAARHDGYLRDYLRTGVAKVIGIGREVVARRKSGETFSADLVINEIKIGGRRLFVGALRDLSERKAAERRAQTAERRLADAIEGIGDGVALFDKDERLVLFNRRYAGVMPALADILKPGTTFETIARALAAQGYYGPVDEAWIAERLRHFRNLEDIEFPAIELNGERHWRALRHYRTRDGGTLLIRTDITEHKRAEQELESTQQLLQTALDSMTDGAALFDKDERLVLFNENFVGKHGLPPGFIKPGMTFADLVEAQFKLGAYIGADKDMVNCRLRKFRALEASEIRLRDPDKGERWVHIHFYRTRDGGTFLVRTDITERKRAEAELGSARRLLQDALDSMTDGIALYDKDERLVLFNESYAHKTWLPRESLKPGMTFAGVIAQLAARGAYGRVDKDWMDRRLRQFRALEPVELCLRDPGGRERWYHVHRYRTRDGGTFVIRADVTEQVQAVNEIERARAAAEDASAAKTKFLASMSHELRTPLNAILGFAQMLDLGAGRIADEKRQEYLTIILRSGQHLLDLVNQILELSRAESRAEEFSIQVLSPAKTAQECVDMVREEAKQRAVDIIDRTQALGPNVCFLGDPVRVRQVVLNLLSNAVKYNRPGGRVALSCARDGNGMIRFAIADNGLGIPPDRHGEVFQPFQRLGREAGQIEGTGIGLALARQLVERMGGRIGFESEPEHGSTFWFDLPEAGNEKQP